MNQQPLLHSIHNTGSFSVKVALVHKTLHALHHFSAIHSTLQNYIAPEYHEKVFFQDHHVGISGQKADSISSCSYSAYADRFITSFNPRMETIYPTSQTPNQSTIEDYTSAIQQ